MKTDVWLPLYPADYLADTPHLTTLQHGAYLLLLFAHWRLGSLPDNDEQLAAITKLGKAEWKKIAPVIREFFDQADGRLTQKRLVLEIEKASNINEKRSDAGKVGAEKRWGRNGKRHADANTKTHATAMRDHWQNDAPSPSPSPSPSNNSVPSERGGSQAPALNESASQAVFEGPPGDRLPDLRTEAWSEGRRIVGLLTGQPAREAGKLVGKLAKMLHHDFAGLLGILREAERLRPMDPTAWLVAAAQQRSDPRAAPKSPLQRAAERLNLIDNVKTIEGTCDEPE